MAQKRIKKLDLKLIAKYKTTRTEGVEERFSKASLRKIRFLIRDGLLSDPLEVTTNQKDINYNKKLLRAITEGLKNLLSIFNVQFKGTLLNPKAFQIPTLTLIKIIKYEINKPMSIVMNNQCEEAPIIYFNIFSPFVYKLLKRISEKRNQRSFSFALGCLNLKRCAPTMPAQFKDVSLEKHKRTLQKEPTQKLDKRERRNFRNLCQLFVGDLGYQQELFLANASATTEIPFKEGGARSVLNDLGPITEMIDREDYMEYLERLEEINEVELFKTEITNPYLEDWANTVEEDSYYLIIDDEKHHILKDHKNIDFVFEERRIAYRDYSAKKSVHQLIAQKLIFERLRYDSGTPVCHVSVVQDPMKCRVITKEPTIHHYLKPLHQKILERLEKYKIFSVLGQKVNSYTFTHIFKKREDEIIASVDYEAATDNVLPEFYQIFHDKLIENIQDQDVLFLLNQNRKMRTIRYPDGSEVEQRNGQLMGSYMSSIVLNLYNLFGVLRSIYPEFIFRKRNTLDAYLRKLASKAKFCGDDLILIATKSQLKKHKDMCKKIGMTLSKGKSYENSNFGIFCSLGFSFNGSYVRQEFLKGESNEYRWTEKIYDRFDLIRFPMVQFLMEETFDYDNKSIPGNDDCKSKKPKTYSLDQKLQMLTVAIQGKLKKFSNRKFYKKFMHMNANHLKLSCRSLWAPRNKNGFGLKIKYFQKIIAHDIEKIIAKNINDDALKMWVLAEMGEEFVPKFLREVDSIFKADSSIKSYLPATSVYHKKIRQHQQTEIFSRNKFDLEEKGEEDRKFLRKRWARIRQAQSDKEEINRSLEMRAAYKIEEMTERGIQGPSMDSMLRIHMKYKTLADIDRDYLPNLLNEAAKQMKSLFAQFL